MPHLILTSTQMSHYLKETEIINFNHVSIRSLVKTLKKDASDKLVFIQKAFEFVRDQIKHSADAHLHKVTCRASEVLSKGHGICFAKSHLLAAILRANDIPAGFCYQKLIFDEDFSDLYCLHGLNGVFIASLQKWIRLDARGNKQGVNAEFNVKTEQLAFPVRLEKGESDDMTLYAKPLNAVIKILAESQSVAEVMKKLTLIADEFIPISHPLSKRKK